MAVVRPPLNDWERLIEPLRPAEELVARRLVGRLGDGWTLYVKPRIGLQRPDLLAVHDRFGVCVIEVRDWDASTVRADESGAIEVRGDDDWAPVAHPRFVAARTRSTIHDRFFAMPADDVEPGRTVRGIVIVPNLGTERARDLLVHPVAPPADREIDVWGREGLEDQLVSIVHGPECEVPDPATLARLRAHLVVAGTTEGSEPIDLEPATREIVENPTGTAIRRMTGPAGSGKSFAIAARAARLAADGREVLALSFSVTMANHLRDLVNARCAEFGADPTLVTCANFHSFCEQMVQDAQQVGIGVMPDTRMRFADSIVAMAMHVFAADFEHRYDAVLVDEGQDFAPSWWNLLRTQVCRPGGEMLLAADARQDIYQRCQWNDETLCVDAGFTEPWIELSGSGRMPADATAVAGRFAAANVFGDAPPDPFIEEHARRSHDTRTIGHWQDIHLVSTLGRDIGREVVRLLREHPELEPGDVAFVCEQHHDGMDAVDEIEAAGYPVQHFFTRDPDDARRRRRYRLRPGGAAVTGSTIHSLKGWGSRAVVMGIDLETRSKRTAYVSMTRVARDPDGGPSFLSVVNADQRVASFAETFESLLASPERAGTSTPTDG